MKVGDIHISKLLFQSWYPNCRFFKIVGVMLPIARSVPKFCFQELEGKKSFLLPRIWQVQSHISRITCPMSMVWQFVMLRGWVKWVFWLVPSQWNVNSSYIFAVEDSIWKKSLHIWISYTKRSLLYQCDWCSKAMCQKLCQKCPLTVKEMFGKIC